MGIGVWYVVEGNADFSVLTDFEAEGSPIFAIIAGVALAFFAMTGFENAANVAEETINPSKTFPRALVGGMLTAGVIYVLVAMTAALTVDLPVLADSDAALLEVVKEGIIPVPVGVMTSCSRSSRWSRSPTPRWSSWSPSRGSSTAWPARTWSRASSPRSTRSGAARGSGLVFRLLVVAALLVVGDILVRSQRHSTSWPASRP